MHGKPEPGVFAAIPDVEQSVFQNIAERIGIDLFRDVQHDFFASVQQSVAGRDRAVPADDGRLIFDKIA